MNKKANTGIIIAVIVGIIILFFFMSRGTTEDTEDSGIGGGASGDSMISVQFKDDDGNVISTTKNIAGVMSIVTSSTYTGIASKMAITVTTINTGNEPLTCDIISTSPTPFDTSLTKTQKTLLATGAKKVAWTSADMDLAQFESYTQPVRFQSTIRCFYTRGGQTTFLTDKTGYIDIKIEPSTVNAGFDVSVGTGGLPTEYCGDGLCQVDETASNCQVDCAVAPLNVKFRTSDLRFVSGSAIAYTDTCGNDLTAYGYSSSSGLLAGLCLNTMTSKGTLLISNLPGGWKTGGSSPSLWKSSTDTNQLLVCDDDGTKYNYVKYDSTDSDKSKVDVSKSSIDTAREVSC